jgi:GNAT superfamily N-acetyltransferase
MPTIDVVRETPCPTSFRVKQLAGMFDLPIKDKLRHEWHVELPIEGLDWHVGLIVGPSGSGKSTVARELFGPCVHQGFDWPAQRSILDGFPKSATTSDCVAALNAVGFSSPPSWCKPFRVLSSGEQFRAELARAMIEYAECPLFVIDEFSSVVDRTAAKIGSCAIARALRRRACRMVAVSCHYDIAPWLQADWILDMKTGHFSRRCLRRPQMEIHLYHAPREIWSMFAPHHYLTSSLVRCSRCYAGFWGDEIVGFAATLQSMGHAGITRVHRLVVLPDYQGIGIGRAMLRMLGDLCEQQGQRLSIVSVHPAMIHGLARDPNWRCAQFYPHGTSRHRDAARAATGRQGVPVARFEYRRGRDAKAN